MPEQLGAIIPILLAGTVLIRIALLHRRGIKAFHFGQQDKSDFLIPPFALFYLYTVLAAAYGFPILSSQRFFQTGPATWIGLTFSLGALLLFVLSLVSFGRSFRVGIDEERPDKLVTSGIFACTRNPIYVAFILMLLGQFLLFPNWLLLVYLVGGVWLIHRQILREEAYLKTHYGQPYLEYCERVRRYV